MDRIEPDTCGTEFLAGPVSIGIRSHASRIIRISFGARPPGDPSSYLQAPAPHPVPIVDAGMAPEAMTLGQLTVGITQNPRRIVFCNRDGQPRLRIAIDEVALSPLVRLHLELVGEQHLYGLGEGGHPFDRLGVTRRFWNFQSNRGQGADIAIPLLLSQSGYAVFFDNAARGMIEPGDTDGGLKFDYSAEPGPFDVYFIGGADLRQVLSDVADLLGHATMPPRWALGYMQSSRHFDQPDEFHHVVERMRQGRLPCDAFIFLSTYGAARGWNRGVGHLEFEPSLFPNPVAAIARLRENHVHVFTHEYPVVHDDSPLHAEAVCRGYLLDHAYPRVAPNTAGAAGYREGQRYLDFSLPEVRAWWWDQHRPLVAAGIEGWWLDGGEGPPADVVLHGGSGAVLHNRFDLLRQQCFAEGEARDNRDRRPYLLCRSGGPGMQRFGAVAWSGDINTTFATLEAQIRIGLNVGLSGVPHWGTDIGGFYLVAPDTGELFVRWLQFGAFCSVFRAHGHVWRRHLPWAHGEAIEAICRRIIELRYRLMPYTYTLAWQAHRLGLPMMRPLVLNYPHDPRVWDLATQYLWGDDILVAPVTRQGATAWTVYLPEGTWYDFWTHEAYRGHRGVTVAAPLDRMPMFVRGGAIVPLGPVIQYDGEALLDDVTLLIYPEGESAFELYEDDGASNAYRDGGWAITAIACRAEASRLTCRVAPAHGDASLIPQGRRYTLQICTAGVPERVELAGRDVLRQRVAPGDAGWWREDPHFLFVRLPQGPAEVQIIW
jgi:alpha-glucosidase (family GH31 glycosyl hydrolase)